MARRQCEACGARIQPRGGSEYCRPCGQQVWVEDVAWLMGASIGWAQVAGQLHMSPYSIDRRLLRLGENELAKEWRRRYKAADSRPDLWEAA